MLSDWVGINISVSKIQGNKYFIEPLLCIRHSTGYNQRTFKLRGSWDTSALGLKYYASQSAGPSFLGARPHPLWQSTAICLPNPFLLFVLSTEEAHISQPPWSWVWQNWCPYFQAWTVNNLPRVILSLFSHFLAGSKPKAALASPCWRCQRLYLLSNRPERDIIPQTLLSDINWLYASRK